MPTPTALDTAVRAIEQALADGPTEGEWANESLYRARESEHGSRCISFITVGKINIADVCDSEGISDMEARANAALITACHPAALRLILAALEGARRDAERYATIRCMNLHHFKDIWFANLSGGGTFDDLIDAARNSQGKQT